MNNHDSIMNNHSSIINNHDNMMNNHDNKMLFNGIYQLQRLREKYTEYIEVINSSIDDVTNLLKPETKEVDIKMMVKVLEKNIDKLIDVIEKLPKI